MVIRVPIALLSALALLLPPILEAQEPVHGSGYHASWWTNAGGLPGNFVTDITQDTYGRLWIIASRVGFRNAEHFTRRFVAHFGLSPRTYRIHRRGR